MGGLECPLYTPTAATPGKINWHDKNRIKMQCKIRAVQRRIFVLSLISQVIPASIEPWPERLP